MTRRRGLRREVELRRRLRGPALRRLREGQLRRWGRGRLRVIVRVPVLRRRRRLRRRVVVEHRRGRGGLALRRRGGRPRALVLRRRRGGLGRLGLRVVVEHRGRATRPASGSHRGAGRRRYGRRRDRRQPRLRIVVERGRTARRRRRRLGRFPGRLRLRGRRRLGQLRLRAAGRRGARIGGRLFRRGRHKHLLGEFWLTAAGRRGARRVRGRFVRGRFVRLSRRRVLRPQPALVEDRLHQRGRLRTCRLGRRRRVLRPQPALVEDRIHLRRVRRRGGVGDRVVLVRRVGRRRRERRLDLRRRERVPVVVLDGVVLHRVGVDRVDLRRRRLVRHRRGRLDLGVLVLRQVDGLRRRRVAGRRVLRGVGQRAPHGRGGEHVPQRVRGRRRGRRRAGRRRRRLGRVGEAGPRRRRAGRPVDRLLGDRRRLLLDLRRADVGLDLADNLRAVDLGGLLGLRDRGHVRHGGLGGLKGRRRRRAEAGRDFARLRCHSRLSAPAQLAALRVGGGLRWCASRVEPRTLIRVGAAFWSRARQEALALRFCSAAWLSRNRCCC